MKNELTDIWNGVLRIIEADLGDPQIYEYFFRGTSIQGVEGETMTILVSTSLAASFFRDQYYSEIAGAVNRDTGTNYKLEFVTASRDAPLAETTKKTPAKPKLFKNAKLDERLTFDSFVVGESDRDALQAATLIASRPGETFNPLFIYGDSGLGKTHLLQAIGNSIVKRFPGKKVLYVSANDFVEEFVSYVTNHQTDQSFSAFFREEVDVLLLDDIQFLRSKEKTMETFFNVFQALTSQNKQIVLTSDQDPHLLDGLSERLKSRFAQGLPVKIKKPDFDTARNILRSKIQFTELKNCEVDEDVINLIAAQFGDNVRELEGALNRLLFCTILGGPCKHITVEIASEALIDLRKAKREIAKPSVSRIVSVVADYYNLTPPQIMGKTRVAQIALARHIAMFLCRELLGMNFTEIGKAFGKDHTSVMNAIAKVENMGKTDPVAKSGIDELKKRFAK